MAIRGKCGACGAWQDEASVWQGGECKKWIGLDIRPEYVAELEADRSKAWEICQKAVERGMGIQLENNRLKSLLRTARGSSFHWPEHFKAEVDAALREGDDGTE